MAIMIYVKDRTNMYLFITIYWLTESNVFKWCILIQLVHFRVGSILPLVFPFFSSSLPPCQLIFWDFITITVSVWVQNDCSWAWFACRIICSGILNLNQNFSINQSWVDCFPCHILLKRLAVSYDAKRFRCNLSISLSIFKLYQHLRIGCVEVRGLHGL